MRLLRVGPPGLERPAALDANGTLRDLSPVAREIDGDLLADAVRLAGLRQLMSTGACPAVRAGVRIGPPVARPGKVVGIGLNYKDHAAEVGVEVPDEPVVFLKAPTTVSGPFDPVQLPSGSAATDYEVELGVVVGRRLRHCSDPAEALAAVAGYLTANDVTERDRVAKGPTWAAGKCADTFTPIGPWLVTADEVGDPQSLALRLAVNDDVRQSGSTALMAYGVAELLVHVSSLMTLEPGDLLLTGTPGGVAVGRPEPKPFLRTGDLVEAEVGGLGRQRTPVVEAGEAR